MIELSGRDLALSFLAVLMIALGAGALVMGVMRPRAAARSVILFGLFSLVYGMLVAAGLPTVEAVSGLTPQARNQIRFDLTYLLMLPLMLLVEQFVGPGWRGTMRATVWLQVAYSTIGIGTDLVAGIPGLVMVAKPYIVVVIGTAALGNILFAARRTAGIPRVLAVGFMSFLATVGLYNLGLIIHWDIPGRIDVLGFSVLVGCLGYAVAVHALDTEARLLSIEREIQTAQRIQASILPQDPPVIPGLTICARYRPMATMAGDFYDFVPIEHGRLGMLVADVSGHGVPASLIASMVKVALNVETPHAADPGTVLNGINTTLVSLLSRDSDYVTACYLVVDPAAGEIRYGEAGHPPPLLRSGTGEISTLDEGGTILGRFPNEHYQGIKRRVGPGSRLLLYTDGVTEAMSPTGESFGMDRLKTFLAERRETTADQFADALLETITTWRGGAKLDDDVTIVVVDLEVCRM